MLQALDPVMVSGRVGRAVEGPCQRLVQNLVDQTALAGARHPGDQNEASQRQVHVEVDQVVLAGAADAEPAPVARPPSLRDRHLRLSTQVRRGKRALRLLDLVERPFRHHFATVLASPRPQVDDPVRLAHRFLVVFDQQDGVAEVAHSLERLEQLGVVSLVQADRGFVQHIEHTLQLAADLGGQPDALAFSSGERPRCSVQVEVTETDILEERQPIGHLLQNLAGYLPLLRGQPQTADHPPQVADGHRGQVVDRAAADGHRQRLGA